MRGSLTDVQQKARAGKLTASRIACLMTGDATAIMRLYREMIGEELPEDLSDVWPVQLGATTEALNLEWYERRGNALSRHGEVVTHFMFPWAAATLDAWDDVLGCPVETKHVGGREPLEIIIDRYQPQMQWQMECTNATQCALSVIMGANAPVIEYIERDGEYAAEMIQRGQQFMDCVAARREPVAMPAVAAPADASKIYDMHGNNAWANSAYLWLKNCDAGRIADGAEKVLKKIMPEDAKKAFGHGIRITRDRASRLSLREDIE